MCPNEIPELTLDQTASNRRKKRHMVLFLFLLPEKREKEETRHSCTCRGEHSKEKTNGVKIQCETVRDSRVGESFYYQLQKELAEKSGVVCTVAIVGNDTFFVLLPFFNSHASIFFSIIWL